MSIRIFTIIFLLIVSVFKMNAQVGSDSTVANVDTVIVKKIVYDKTQEIKLSYNYDFASYLNNAFLNTYYSSGFIDNGLKDENLKRLNGENNPLGMSSDLIIQYRNKPGLLFGSSSLGFSAALEWHSINEMIFTDDFFSLMFYGTKQFAGEEAVNLHNIASNNLNYYQIKSGLFKKDELRNIEYGFQIAFNLGNQYSRFTTDNASLLVDSLGKYIDFEGKLSYESTNVTGGNYSKIQGYGVSADLYFQKYVLDKYRLRVEINNLGYILWNNQTQIFNEEEKIHFEGIEIDNIFDYSSNYSNTSLQDSITNYINDNSNYQEINMYTPFDISIFYMKYLNKNVSIYGKFRYRFQSFEDIYFAIGSDYHFNKKISLGGNINYGAYSKINIGVNFQMKIKTNFAIEIQSRYMTGIITHSFSGVGAFCQLNYKF